MPYDTVRAMNKEQLLQLRIARRHLEAEDILSFELVADDGSPLPRFTAGAHVDVHLPNGLIRQYSLCNAPHDPTRYLIAVLREPASRGGSKSLHDDVHEGQHLGVGLPRNLFPLCPAAQHSILIAGGIGVTPILAMAEQLAHSGADFEMHYCTRSPERTAFRERLVEAPFADRVNHYYDSEQPLDLETVLSNADDGHHIYICGPQGFIEHVRDAAFALGWNDDNIHFEYFGAVAPKALARDEEFEIEIASSGVVIPVPAGTTALDVLAEYGIALTSSCHQGICGSCLTTVCEGEPDHRDQFLSEAEKSANDRFLPCCSRAFSPRLVLDL